MDFFQTSKYLFSAVAFFRSVACLNLRPSMVVAAMVKGGCSHAVRGISKELNQVELVAWKEAVVHSTASLCFFSP